MNMPHEHHHPDRFETDESFAEIVAGLGDLTPVHGDDDFETVRIEVPDLEGRRAMVMTIEAEPELAELIRAEFSPERMLTMVRAMQALSQLADPPGR